MRKLVKSIAAFFKQNYKPLLAIVLIAVISGGLLALGNSVFSISDEQRRERDLKKIYAAAHFSDDLEIDGQFKENEKYGKTDYIIKAYDTDVAFEKGEPSAIIIKTTSGVIGYKGYSEIVLAVGTDGEIKNMIISSYGGDDRTASITRKYLENSYIGKNINDVEFFYMENPTESGVDVSAHATAKATMKSVCAAVNMAVYYIRGAGLLA